MKFLKLEFPKVLKTSKNEVKSLIKPTNDNLFENFV